MIASTLKDYIELICLVRHSLHNLATIIGTQSMHQITIHPIETVPESVIQGILDELTIPPDFAKACNLVFRPSRLSTPAGENQT